MHTSYTPPQSITVASLPANSCTRVDNVSDTAGGSYKTVKTSLKSIARDPYIVELINTKVFMIHRIAIHTLQFLKLYLIYSYETSGHLPAVSNALIINIMKTLAPKQTRRGRPPKDETVELRKHLLAFHLQYYKPLMLEEETLSCEHLSRVLEYMAINIESVYLNNIRQHFVTCLERYINVIAKKKSRLDAIKNSALDAVDKEEQTSKLCGLLRGLKNDILSLDSDMCSPVMYHNFILQTRQAILPVKATYRNDNVYYDIQCSPEQYMLGMFRMTLEIENLGETTISVFPIRTSIIPKYIKIDTTTLVHLLIDREKHGHSKSHYITKGNMLTYQDEIWSLFFKTEKALFSNRNQGKHRFNYMIETDGVGCSVLLIRRRQEIRVDIRQPRPTISDVKYIDEVPTEVLQRKKLVAIDPNLSDLLYCVTREADQIIKLRYTQDQRRKETKSKKYMRLIEHFKLQTVIEGRTVIQWEAELCKHSRKTVNFMHFQGYIKHKNLINSKLLPFYQTFLYRKLRLNGYINRQKSEARFLNRFTRVFGSKEHVVIGIGDYEQHQHRKYKEPAKGKGFRKMFKRAGYNSLYLVDEHKTSCRCNNCGDIVEGNYVTGGKCQTFRVCKNPRPWRKDENIIRHGLLMCQTCSKLWCRDTNAALNILEIMKAAQLARQRPKYLSRGKVSISNTTSVLPTILSPVL